MNPLKNRLLVVFLAIAVASIMPVSAVPTAKAAVPQMLPIYARACGWALARAHAKAGDPPTISGYLGKHDKFDVAMDTFACAYADQAERDHSALKAAVRAARSTCRWNAEPAVDAQTITPSYTLKSILTNSRTTLA